MSNLKKFFLKFKFAFEGLKLATKEQTFKIFCIFAILVIFLMFLFKVSFFEKLILLMTITFVMSLELINSQIEKVLDILQLNYDPKIKQIKDVCAAAVFLACIGAAILGILIFWPYFSKYIL